MSIAQDSLMKNQELNMPSIELWEEKEYQYRNVAFSKGLRVGLHIGSMDQDRHAIGKEYIPRWFNDWNEEIKETLKEEWYAGYDFAVNYRNGKFTQGIFRSPRTKTDIENVIIKEP